MGILRSDRVSGLGGANAINGSVRFGNDGSSTTTRGTSLNIAGSGKSDLNFAGNDFTWEAWVYPFDNVQWNCVYSQSWGLQIYIDTSSNGLVKYYVGSDDSGTYAISGATSANGTINADAWNHVAFSRNGNSWTVFTNGTAATSSTGISQSLIPSNADYTIGIFNSIRSGNDAGSYFGFQGYISNLRIRTGAHYTASFTPPAERLEKTSDTVLLCCQSPGDVTKEETGKILTPTTKNTNDKPPSASHFAPDKGEDYGTTFADNTKFDTLSYMVPPGGTTAERGRGRGVFGGGIHSPNPSTTAMQYIQIQSAGTAVDFGSLTAARSDISSSGNGTRGVLSGGYNPAASDVIDYITIATTSNATDFGNLTQARGVGVGCVSSSTRGISGWGGYTGSNVNTIDYITIATAGNATDFGDTVGTNSRNNGQGSSPTRGVRGGGYTSTSVNQIDYLTIATTGNSADFGDLTQIRYGNGGVSSNTRCIWGGGYTYSPSAHTNTLDYITIATTGNAADFGDLISVRTGTSALGNSIRGAWFGGYSPTWVNIIDYVTIATTGNANDFGDGINTVRNAGAISDSHGGLS